MKVKLFRSEVIQIITYVFFCALFLLPTTVFAEKSRVVVCTDIGGDPDDEQSLVRLLTYANEVDIEALIASENHYDQNRSDIIKSMVKAYGQVSDRLNSHESGFPSASRLLSVIKKTS